MNNYWHTNYTAAQEGTATTSYAVIPHGAFSAEDSYRWGVESGQPLIVRTGAGRAPAPGPLFLLSSQSVVATSVSQSVDGKAMMVRLFNASQKEQACTIEWRRFAPAKVYVSSLAETKDAVAPEKLTLPPFGITTLRCER